MFSLSSFFFLPFLFLSSFHLLSLFHLALNRVSRFTRVFPPPPSNRPSHPYHSSPFLSLLSLSLSPILPPLVSSFSLNILFSLLFFSLLISFLYLHPTLPSINIPPLPVPIFSHTLPSTSTPKHALAEREKFPDITCPSSVPPELLAEIFPFSLLTFSSIFSVHTLYSSAHSLVSLFSRFLHFDSFPLGPPAIPCRPPPTSSTATRTSTSTTLTLDLLLLPAPLSPTALFMRDRPVRVLPFLFFLFLFSLLISFLVSFASLASSLLAATTSWFWCLFPPSQSGPSPNAPPGSASPL